MTSSFHPSESSALLQGPLQFPSVKEQTKFFSALYSHIWTCRFCCGHWDVSRCLLRLVEIVSTCYSAVAISSGSWGVETARSHQLPNKGCHHLAIPTEDVQAWLPRLAVFCRFLQVPVGPQAVFCRFLCIVQGTCAMHSVFILHQQYRSNIQTVQFNVGVWPVSLMLRAACEQNSHQKSLELAVFQVRQLC